MRDLEQKIAQWDYDMEHHAEGNTTEYSIAVEAIEECKQLLQRLRAAEDALALIASLETEQRSMLAPRAALGDAITTALPWRRAVEYKAT
jgi:hypothetical protein